jgi:hypothetical protein
MNKKVKATILIAVMGVLSLSIGLRVVHASVISGQDPSWNTNMNDQPWFCQCLHDDEGQYDDTMAGLGVMACYDPSTQSNPAFYWGEWIFEVTAGDDGVNYNNSPYDISAPMQCCYAINAYTSSFLETNYNDYNSAPWSYYTNSLQGGGYYCYNVGYTHEGTISPDFQSAEGATIGQFYQIGNPSNEWFIEAYTQVPPGQSSPNGWAYLTAW